MLQHAAAVAGDGAPIDNGGNFVRPGGDPMLRQLALVLAAIASLSTAAADRLVGLDTRPGVRTSYWLMERDGANATVLLLPGGAGGIGLKAGAPTSENFLVRSRDFFAAAGYNVAILGKPSDQGDMDERFRTSEEHVADLRRVVEKLRHDLGKPVWLVGTSRGTISAAAIAAAENPPEIAGVVLTSSVTSGQQASVTSLDLSRIRVPVLVMHHRDDGCRSCNPREAPRIVDALKNSPVKKFILLTGGGGARGPVCEALHYHGYIGMEREAVETITAWMRDPQP
jgi:pimeloyl-ACP methyl ester carboxylesterase